MSYIQDYSDYVYNPNSQSNIFSGSQATVGARPPAPQTSTSIGATGVFTGSFVGQTNFIGDMTIAGDIMPASHNTYNLGHSGMAFKGAYFDAHTIFIGGVPISSDSVSTIILPASTTIGGINPGTIRIVGACDLVDKLTTTVTNAINIGDAYIVTENSPSEMYVLTVANG